MKPSTLFNKISALRVFIIGDVMLDNYWFGQSNRMSPEAPVPIVSLEKKESRLGGAFNVSLNCKALGAKTYTFSVIGKDEEGKRLLAIAKNKGLETKYIKRVDNRITTSKSRVISEDKHLLRIDDEQTNNLNRKQEHAFTNHCLKAIQILKPDIIILQDYNKGVLTPTVIKNVIQHAKEIGAKIAVDPKFKNFFAYKGVDIFKPNLKEIQDGLSIKTLKVNKTNLKEIHKQLTTKLKHKVSFITLSEKGVFIQKENKAKIIKAHKRNIVDVSGAGDTVIATAALVYAATENEQLMAKVSNIAGGLVCEEVGVVSIQRKKLIQAIKTALPIN